MASQNFSDLYYPSVMTPGKNLDPGKVDGALKRAFDLIYQMNPPNGDAGSIWNNVSQLPESFTIKLDTGLVMLADAVFAGSSTTASWNAHTLSYRGEQYEISAGSTTNKWIYWQKASPNAYQSLAATSGGNSQFPQLGVDDFLIAVFLPADAKTYEFWNAKMAPAFISTALIADATITNALIQNLAVSDGKIVTLTASKITTGTLAATVTITADNGCDIILSRADSNPAELKWSSTSTIFADSSLSTQYWQPATDNSNLLQFGTGALAWNQFSVYAESLNLNIGADSVDYIAINMTRAGPNQITFNFGSTNNIAFDEGGFIYPTTSGYWDLGSSGLRFDNAWFSGTITTSGAITASGTITGNLFSGSGASLTSLPAISLTAGVSGILPIANGGTNASSFTSTRLLYYDGSAIVGSSNLVYSTNLTLTSGSIILGTSGSSVGLSDDVWTFTNDSDIAGYIAGVKKFQIDSTSHATLTNTWLYHNGSLKQITVVSADYGDGTKNHLFVS